MLSLIFSWAFDRGFMADNPTLGMRGIRRPKDLPKQNRAWSFDELFTVLAEAVTKEILAQQRLFEAKKKS